MAFERNKAYIGKKWSDLPVEIASNLLWPLIGVAPTIEAFSDRAGELGWPLEALVEDDRMVHDIEEYSEESESKQSEDDEEISEDSDAEASVAMSQDYYAPKHHIRTTVDLHLRAVPETNLMPKETATKPASTEKQKKKPSGKKSPAKKESATSTHAERKGGRGKARGETRDDDRPDLPSPVSTKKPTKSPAKRKRSVVIREDSVLVNEYKTRLRNLEMADAWYQEVGLFRRERSPPIN